MPEEGSAVTPVPEMAKVAGCTNATFPGTLGKGCKPQKAESIDFFSYSFTFSDRIASERHYKFIVLRLF